MSITIESTTDTPEAIQEALGKSAEPVEQPPAKEPEPKSPEAAIPPEAKTAGDGEPDKEEVQEEESKAVPKGVQKRIDRLTREKYELAGRVKAMEDRLAEKPPAEKPKEPAVIATEGRPDPNDPTFKTYEEYLEALTDWKTEQKLKARDAKQARAEAESKQAEKLDAWAKRVEAIRAEPEYENFDDVLRTADEIQVPAAIGEVILDSEVGPQLAYWLAKNMGEYQRIAALGPLAAARELGKIEAALTKPAEPAQAPKPKVSSAPKPITPVGGRPSGTTKTPDEMEFQDYKRWRENGGGR